MANTNVRHPSSRLSRFNLSMRPKVDPSVDVKRTLGFQIIILRIENESLQT